jgi:pheromone a factor receptor
MADNADPYPDTIDHANAILLPMFSLLAILFTILPFCHFWKVKNFPALNIVFVNDLLCLQYFINAMIWRNNNITTWFKGYIYCDIQAATRVPFLQQVSPSPSYVLPVHLLMPWTLKVWTLATTRRG